jgi:hypothetical protein
MTIALSIIAILILVRYVVKFFKVQAQGEEEIPSEDLFN